MAALKGIIVTKYAKMWPREVFDIRSGKNRFLEEVKQLLKYSGVYVLYKDDQPYYVGKATKKRLFKRIRQHAINPKDRYYNFWNFFSAFVVPDEKHLSEVEGLLIATIPTDNRAVPKIKKIDLPSIIAKQIRSKRIIEIK